MSDVRVSHVSFNTIATLVIVSAIQFNPTASTLDVRVSQVSFNPLAEIVIPGPVPEVFISHGGVRYNVYEREVGTKQLMLRQIKDDEEFLSIIIASVINGTIK